MDSAAKMCLECLQRRIEADFSGRLTFLHSVSDYRLPFASAAVVQVSNSDLATPPQFVFNYMPYRTTDCFSKYVDEFCVIEGDITESSSTVKQVQAEVSVGISSDTSSDFDTASTECRHFSNGRVLDGCATCKISTRFSCSRAITSLAPTALIGHVSFELFEEIASSFSSGSFEGQLLHSLCQLIEGKSAGRDGANFLSLLGLPSFKENGFPGCIRHPNICPILGVLKSPTDICLVLPKTPFTLENIMHYSPAALQFDWKIQFLIYQLLSALSYLHGLGIAHGNLSPSNILLTDTSWCWLQISEKQLLNTALDPSGKSLELSAGSHCFEGCPSHALYADLSLLNSVNWQSCFYSWWKGELSNFEYLLVLNRLAGRRWGDHTFYSVMPWVIDFSVKPDENNIAGWRDLSKSKWRLAKGDEQLDFTYSTSEMPHHVSDECLSELAVCSYKARRLPLSVLRQAVRSVYEPNEYPSNMQRLYQWTPDECIPEFYCDPHIFNSLHSGMPDLAVPSWAGTSEEFVKLHRDALESNRVSLQMHKWIDITFGYKMSGEAAIAAKNVMLPASTSNVPRSTGRRQLFSQPHPPRQIARRKTHHNNNGQPENNSQSEVDSVEGGDFLIKTNHLNKLEEATSFCEKSWHLDPCYNVHSSDCLKNNTSENELSTDIGRNVSPRKPDSTRNYCEKSTIDSNSLLENIEEGDDSVGYQELMLWRQACSPKINSKRAADDIFSVGCILAELHMGKPLFGSSSLASYLDSGILPGSVQDIPHHMKVIVKACIENDWKRRPSVKCLLESPYFPKSVKSSYYFLAAFHGLSRNDLRLQYAATFAKQGALKRMGAFGAAMCAPYCLPLIVTSASDAEAEWAYLLLAEFLKCLKSEAVMKFVVPSVQRVLQGTGYSHLKVSLLQGSFMQDLWNRIGKQAYFETIHLLIISNLCIAPHKSSTSAASVLLIGFSEELGVPVTVHQTILPLMLSFGKGICNDGIDVLIRIGGLIGEKFVVKQILPLLNTVVNSCICTLSVSKPEPVQSWGSSALIDCLTTLDGLVPVLTTETIVKELIEDRDSPYVKIIMHRDIGIQVRQVVNDIFDLASSGRVASCDGTVHIWNGQTGRLISIFSERSLASSTQLAERDEDNMLHFNPLPSGMLSSAFHGNSYTTMDYLGFSDRLIVGTGNGSLRFIDVNQGQKLHLWRSECVDSGFPPIISSICSSSSVRMSPEESMGFPSWIAAASSTGQCRLFDLRSGKIISSWQAHDGYVTELAATADYQLVSSSLDKTLRIWDLRRNWSSEQRVFRGYSDGVSGFSVWGQNIISICRNKIGLSSLQSHADEDGHYRASLQHVYMADGEAKNASVLSAITILPFSRLFLLGTEDGYLKICC
ncbi:protein GFS12 isoform X3 [Salvia splendens]|uniref:protein GFS12 isoform X3 n=1 Tax=Salvia splendens TaxID=180675 RepID=UPI001C277CBB|nr:protein GFS12 isoform X3 [Salvia splendens]